LRAQPVAFAVTTAAMMFSVAAGDAYAPTGLPWALGTCTAEEEAAPPAVEPAQAVLARYLSRRFLVAGEATQRMVSAAYSAARDVGLDPLLVLAVISVESRFNPIAESALGAKGLMQIIPKYHLEKLLDHGGEDALLDPQVNIMVGARILREYQRRLGDTEAALQMYAGAFDEPTSTYANKVLAEKARLEALRQKARKQSV
jgi:soluble lytic murein transglycosylase-like protein